MNFACVCVCAVTALHPAHAVASALALWPADKDYMDDERHISRTKEIFCFIV